MSQFSRISICVEMDGRVYAVALPHSRATLLMHLAGGLTDDGKLPLIRLDDSHKFGEITPHKDQSPPKEP